MAEDTIELTLDESDGEGYIDRLAILKSGIGYASVVDALGGFDG